MPTHPEFERAVWDAIGQALTAHAIVLRDTGIVDDDAAAALLTAIDGVRRGEPPNVSGSLARVAAFDDRVNSLIAPSLVGAGRIGRARHDLAAAAARLVLRERTLALAEAALASRAMLLDLAESHVFTLLPAWSPWLPLQPTNLAHFLTGAIAPLTRASAQLQRAHDAIDRSPLGAGALAGTGLPVDREQAAELVGSEDAVESTFDAVSAVDHLSLGAFAVMAVTAPMRRLGDEFLVWLRTEPQALRLAEVQFAPGDADLPHFRPPVGLERLVAESRRVEHDAETVDRLARAIPYGPVGEASDEAQRLLAETMTRSAAIHADFRTLLAELEINRAWLARNAGRALVTAGELADLLMAEEGLDPASARAVAARVAGQALAEGIEASGITPEMIDAAALLSIGRELGIPVERLGAYFAPRRFVEKRALLGGPAPGAIRDVLARERARLHADRRWLESATSRIAQAAESRELKTTEIMQAAAG